jgi:hypothetical protein
MSLKYPSCSSPDWGVQLSRAAPGRAALYCSNCPALVLFLACFLTCPLASQRGFHALFLARLQVKGVSLDLLDDVFLLHFPLKTAKSVLEGFPLLQSNFRQPDAPPDSPCRTV